MTTPTQNTTTNTPQIDDLPLGALVQDKAKNKIFKVCRAKGEEEKKILKCISNFSLNVLAKGCDKFLFKINSKTFVDTLDFTSSLVGFRKYIRPYIWHGTANDLEALAELATSDLPDTEDLIVISDQVGFFSNQAQNPDNFMSFWIFENTLFFTHKNGQKLPSFFTQNFTPNSILKIDNFFLHISHENINKALIPRYFENETYNLSTFLQQWLRQFNNPRLLYSLLGWIISSLFLEHVNRLRQCSNFPFYVVTAGTETGKTALLSNCMRMLGVNYVGENYASGVTAFVEVVEFAQVSCMPIWRDEYKNEKYALAKEGWLRSVYTRSGVSRGNKDQQVRQYPSRATLLLSGEDITEDAAVARRMIKVRLKPNQKVTGDVHLENSKVAARDFGKAFPLILSTPFNDDIFLAIFNNYELPGDSVQKDELMCYAALGAVFGKDVGIEAIKVAEIDIANTQTDIINRRPELVDDFFSALDSFFLEKSWYESIYNQQPKVLDFFFFPKTKDNSVYLKFPALYSLIMKNKPRDEYKWSRKAIGQLIIEAYGASIQPRRIDDHSERVMIVDNIDKFTDAFGDLVERIRKVKEKWDIVQSPLDNLTPNGEHAEINM